MRLGCWFAGALVVAAAACGGEGELGAFEDGAATCGQRSVRVIFDPRADVVVESEGTRLAYASFSERMIDPDCDVFRYGPASNRMKESPYRNGGLDQGIYRRTVELTCKAGEALGIDLHPIFDATLRESDGSVLLVLVGDSIVVSAVLKKQGDPQASRIYHAPKYCTVA